MKMQLAINNYQLIIGQKIYRGFLLTFFIINFSLSILTAQTIKRIELPTQNDENAYQVISLANEGILLVTRTGKKTFNIAKFDNNLEKLWATDGELESNESYIDYTQEGSAVFLLFSKNNNNYYEIFRITTSIGIVQKFTFDGLKNFEISEFKVRNNNAYLAGMVKEEPVLQKVSFSGGSARIISGGLQGSSSIQSIDIDSLTNEVSISYSVKKGKNNFIVVKRFAETGKMLDQMTVEPADDLALLTGKIFGINDSTQLMVGNYGYRGYQSNGSPMSQGLYISDVNNENSSTKYHSFVDFKNFFTYLSEKEQAKIEKKIEKKKANGDELKLNYRLLIHDIIQKNGQYILVAEVFYPEFHYNNSSYNNSPFGYGGFNNLYSSPFSRYYYGMNSWAWNPWLYGNSNRGQVFDGFRYTHAIVAGFDTNGNLLWDNSIGFDEVKSMELKEKIKVKVEDKDIVLMYSNKGKLNSKIIQGNQVIEGNKTLEINTLSADDKVKITETDDLQFWYDNFYLAWGNQKIQNKNEGTRKVFYVSKIAF